MAAWDGPTRPTAVNQSTFVKTNGPTIAYPSPSQTPQPRSPKSWLVAWGALIAKSGNPHREQDDGAYPVRRVRPHQRRDPDRVPGPRDRHPDGEEVPAEVAGQVSTRARRDERDAAERDYGRERSSFRNPFDADQVREKHGEDRRRPEDQRRRCGGRELECIDEADLVEQQRRNGQADEAPGRRPAYRERPFDHDREGGEQGGCHSVAHGRVRERLETVREHVLRHREVEGPHQDRADEKDVCGRRPVTHPRTLPRRIDKTLR